MRAQLPIIPVTRACHSSAGPRACHAGLPVKHQSSHLSIHSASHHKVFPQHTGCRPDRHFWKPHSPKWNRAGRCLPLRMTGQQHACGSGGPSSHGAQRGPHEWRVATDSTAPNGALCGHLDALPPPAAPATASLPRSGSCCPQALWPRTVPQPGIPQPRPCAQAPAAPGAWGGHSRI